MLCFTSGVCADANNETEATMIGRVVEVYDGENGVV
jgi:hypothetical protein